MNGTFFRSRNKKGCAPSGRRVWNTHMLLPIFNAFGISTVKSVLVFHFSFFIFHFLSAQQYNFKKYSVADGLGSSTINHIFQDSRGYIWFATQDGGVSRFNGSEFRNFTKAEGLISNNVTCIAEDRIGNMWFGTASGASYYNGNKFTNYDGLNGLSSGTVYGIYAHPQGSVWFACQSGGIAYLKDEKFYWLTQTDSIAPRETFCVTKDKSGNIWFGAYEGIYRYRNGNISNIIDKKNFPDRTFFSVHVSGNNTVWFGSTGGDVVMIRPDSVLEQLPLPPDCKNDFIGSIAEDENGNIWLAIDHGLLKYNGASFKLFSEQEGISVNTVQAVMCDYEGNIWAGTLSGGVNLLTSEAFVHFSGKEGLTSKNITAICRKQDDKGLYIGTGNGLFLYSPGTTPPFKKVLLKEVEGINISSLSLDSKGMLWVTAQEGIFVLEAKGNTVALKKKYTTVAGKRVVSPLQVVHDLYGKTWIATFGSGVICVSNAGEKIYDKENGLATNNILTAYCDVAGTLWFGTLDAGLLKCDGKVFTQISVNEGLPNDAVWCISQHPRGEMFFGTGESGFCSFDGKKFRTYSKADGLSSNYVPALVFDPFWECIWVAGEKGLEQITLSTSDSIGKVHRYKEQEGFTSAGINQNGIWAGWQGSLWLATVNGLWLYNPEMDPAKNIAPKIELTDIRLFYQTGNLRVISATGTLHNNIPENPVLPYKSNHLTFDIQALTTEDVLYTFILEGQDESWSVPSANRAITYSNISPGDYTFKAKAINGNGISSELISYSFVINPPWWSTWWFRLIVIMATVSSLVAFIKAREKVLRDRNVKLEETVKLRTKEIEEQKQTVQKMLSEKEVLLKEIHHRVKNNLQTISSMLELQSMELKDEDARKAIIESQSRVRSIALVHQKLYQTEGLEKVELSGFVKDLTTELKSLYQTQSEKVAVHLNIPKTYILIDKAIPLGLIITELFTNSLKYAFEKAETGTIEISLQVAESETASRKVKLTYRDSGRGFAYREMTNHSPTLGIELINLLSEQIGAVHTYSNVNGSEFVFTFGINI